VVEKFHYLKMGLAIVLTFIGTKMLVVAVGIHIPIWISLVFVAVVLLSSVAASLLWAKDADLDIEVDLPEDFDSPFEDDEPGPAQKLDQEDKLDLGAKTARFEMPEETDSQNEELENIERR
jgi:hypothetical protein